MLNKLLNEDLTRAHTQQKVFLYYDNIMVPLKKFKSKNYLK